MKSYLDYFQNTLPVCPYCDHKLEDVREYVGADDDDSTEITCDACGKDYTCTTNLSVSFTTVGDCEVHKFWKYSEESFGGYTCQVCAREIYDFQLDGQKYQQLTKDRYELMYGLETEPTKEL